MAAVSSAAASIHEDKLFGGSNNGPNKIPPGDREIDLQRTELPIYKVRANLVKHFAKIQTAIVIGETASGKTTQIPQYLMENGFTKRGIIACTQPRRVAAISIATRVAQEMHTDLGLLVGYCVRFEDVTSPQTKVKYMTDGMLLREAILDPFLTRYSVVILDEAHERTVHTDVLFGIVKKAQQHRAAKNIHLLKVVVMSATMDVDHFSSYFNTAPVMYIEGRLHPVEVNYTKEHQSDYLFSAMATVVQLHQHQDTGDFLVFLTGQEEIDGVVKTLRQISQGLNSVRRMIVYPLYAALSSTAQIRVFKTTPTGCRKVIVSTNIAETSVTIPGIRYVIDTGMVKAKVYSADSGLDVLKVQRISKAQAWQRAGRAGRESSGFCYRLYTETEYNSFAENFIPEIQRCNMANVCLQMLAMGIQDVATFDFMDKPPNSNVDKAMEQLKWLGAVKSETFLLADIGRKMAAFPVDPKYSKVLLMAESMGCTEEILTIISMMSVESIFITICTKMEEATRCHQKFLSSEGDHISLLNVYRAYRGVKSNKEWCHANFIHHRNMTMASDIRAQLRALCISNHITLASCNHDYTTIRRCLTSGFFMNAAELQKDRVYLTLDNRQTVHIHPSSSLFQFNPAYVIYNEIVKTSKCYMRDVSIIDAEWLLEFAPEYFESKRIRSKVSSR